MSKKLVELVNLWATYEEQQPGLDIRDFCVRYLAEQDAADGPLAGLPVNNMLGALVGRLSRYALMYSKKALAPLELSSVEDFVYLVIVADLGTPRKSEVIYQALSEFPTGIDIIKRLTGMGLLSEIPDETDRRSKRLRLTEHGQMVLGQAFVLVQEASDAAFGTLSDLEKQMLARVLGRLDTFHWEHYKETRNAKTIAQIREALEA